MSIDPRVEYLDIMKCYEESPKQNKINALILGSSGSGKTFLMRTCPKPVHIDSFDLGGTKGLKEWIKKGEIIPDVRWELENPLVPTVYKKWKETFRKRIQGGYFDHIGTYVIDSSTTWGDAIMNDVLLKASIPGQAPRFTHDYVPQKVELRNKIAECTALPCHFILLGHHEMVEDVSDTGKTVQRFRFLTTGKGTVTIPLMFDELYTIICKESSSGVSRHLVIARDGVHESRSRMAGNGLLDPVEEPDIRKLLKKAGLSWEDKPLLKED